MVAVPVSPRESRRSPNRQRSGSRPTWQLALLGLVLLGLGGVIGFSVNREVVKPTDSPRGSSAAQARIEQRPALTADEQAYVEALWPVHTDLEVAAERVALGAIFYKTNDLDRTQLKSRLEQALSSYRAADEKLRQLKPPQSLQNSHEGYLAAVRAFEQSTLEMLRMFEDGSDDHLQTAYPRYLEGTNLIRDLGGNFWPDEFPPN
jgi:hypothetical protein